MKKTFANPYVLLSLTALFWSGNMVVGRGITDSVPPITLAFWRWTLALVLILPFALPHLRAQWPALKAAWRPVVILGILSVGGYNTFAYIALQYTTATNATMLNSFIPVATIALAFVFLGKRLSPIEGLGVVVSLLGVFTIVGKGSIDTFLGLSLNLGDLWMLLAVLTWGLYTVGLQWRPQGVHPMLLLAALTVVGVITLMPFYAFELYTGRYMSLSPTTAVALLYVAVFPSFLGYIFYNSGIAAVGPSRGALFIHLMPVFGTLLAAIFLGERPYWYHFVGIALVFTGIFLTTRKTVR
ncbi:MAG: DMT family transporter [Zoogloeaceae bacterium]|nr:DMT family transporter [Zoogloeaceae bacterium]